MASVGVVVIGRNEGERLRRGLAALGDRIRSTVYVDSGSSDGSLDAARALGAEVIDLDLTIPFTAARARNAGLARLVEQHPDIAFVQFLDGDCELHPNWLDTASKALAAERDIVALFGRLRERHPEQSVYNRFCDIEWDMAPLGEAKACGGNALMRVAALQAAGGYDPTVLAAEDDELCLRLRQAGGRIVRLDAEMGWHDAAITRFAQWWTRSVRTGFAYAQGADMHGRGPERHFVAECRRAWSWLALVTAAFVLAWPTHGWSLLLFAYFAFSGYRFYRYVRSKDVAMKDAACYAAAAWFVKLPHCIGIVRYWWRRWRRGPLQLIEYK
ncbi:MAG: glycosyltransferase [Gemmataceae bacterium]